MKAALISCVLIAPLIPLFDGPSIGAQVVMPQSQPCANAIAHEPLILFEVAGSTLAAQYDRTLTVYADGALVLSDAFGRSPYTRVQVDSSVVLDLQASLRRAGAQVLCDMQYSVTDVPLRTLTMLGGAQDTRAHTFSYWVNDGEYAPIDALLENFIAEHFN